MYVVRVSKVSARGRDIGESYNDKLVCARDGRWSRWRALDNMVQEAGEAQMW